MKKYVQFTALMAAVSFSNYSSAYIVTLDPSQFDSGTNVSHAYQGVSLYSARMDQPDPNQPSYLVLTNDVFVTDCTGCKPQVEGTKVFGKSPVSPTFDYELFFANQFQSHNHYSDGNVLMAVFANPTNYVQIIGSGATTFTPFRMDYWGIDGSWLGSCADIVNGTCNSTRLQTPPNPWPTNNTDQTITSCYTNLPEIAFVTAGGSDGPGYISQLSYNYFSVPEPAAMWLVGFGLAGLITVKRKSKAVNV